jgi:hypothetical protein
VLTSTSNHKSFPSLTLFAQKPQRAAREEKSSKRGFSPHKLIVGGDENYSINYVEEENFGERQRERELIERH